MNRFKYGLIHWRAHRALAAAMQQDFARAGRMINKVNKLDHGLVCAMQLWVDATVEHASAGHPGARVAPGKLVAWNRETGEVMAPDAVNRGPATAWALAVVDARSTSNGDAFARLMSELPTDDPVAAGSYVGALLVLCASSITDFPRGYALHTAEMNERERAQRDG